MSKSSGKRSAASPSKPEGTPSITSFFRKAEGERDAKKPTIHGPSSSNDAAASAAEARSKAIMQAATSVTIEEDIDWENAIKISREATKLVHTDTVIETNDTEQPVEDPLWGENRVKMPFSKSNVFKDTEKWPLIARSLLESIESSRDLEKCILSYNKAYCQTWNFQGLHSYCEEFLDEDRRRKLFASTIPGIVRLTLQIKDLVAEGLPLLVAGENGSVRLTQLQVASLLGNAFFCTYPRRNVTSKNSSYPSINFNTLFNRQGYGPNERCCTSSQAAKFDCIFHYFDRIAEGLAAPDAIIVISRCVMNENLIPAWGGSSCLIPKMEIRDNVCHHITGCIEDAHYSEVQTDFANKVIGGGVIGRGCVQEEIRFMLSPELIISRLVLATLEDDECAIIQGSERFSRYKGYGDSFEFDGDFVDTTPIVNHIRCTTVLAIDAAYYGSRSRDGEAAQYKPSAMRRDLVKAFCGFKSCFDVTKQRVIASGNWGCGVFGGDLALKAMIQLVAAGQAQTSLSYYTFGNQMFADDLRAIHAYMREVKASVGQVWTALVDFGKYNTMDLESLEDENNDSPRAAAEAAIISSDLFEFLRNRLEQ